MSDEGGQQGPATPFAPFCLRGRPAIPQSQALKARQVRCDVRARCRRSAAPVQLLWCAQARRCARELAATCHSAAVPTAACSSRISAHHSTHGCECEDMSPKRREEKRREDMSPKRRANPTEGPAAAAGTPGGRRKSSRRSSATARWQELLTSPVTTVAQVPAGSPQVVVSRRRRERRSCGGEQAAATAGGSAAGPLPESWGLTMPTALMLRGMAQGRSWVDPLHARDQRR